MSKIRLISGIYGSRLIDTPNNSATHPMGNRERQAIFNQISEYVSDSVVLDAFAGSGALGFEVLSRGAKHVDFLEKDVKAIKTIQQNAQALGCTEQISILRKLDPGRKYDLVFVDPPYDNPQYSLVEQITQLLKPSGILVLSHPATPPPPNFPHLTLTSDRKYAAARIKIFML